MARIYASVEEAQSNERSTACGRPDALLTQFVSLRRRECS